MRFRKLFGTYRGSASNIDSVQEATQTLETTPLAAVHDTDTREASEPVEHANLAVRVADRCGPVAIAEARR